MVKGRTRPVAIFEVTAGGKKEQPKKKGFGLSSLSKPFGPEKQTAQVTASAGARGVAPDRDAKGGANPALVAATVTAAELAEFKKGIAYARA